MTAGGEGWGWPGNARKAHYFRGAHSLCDHWLCQGPLDPDTGEDSPDDCTACRRLLRAEQQA